jgi:hypothetical protein
MTDAFTPLESLNLTGRYYRTGTHLPRPSGIDAMTIKKDDEIQLVRTYRKLSDQDKTAFLDHIKKFV